MTTQNTTLLEKFCRRLPVRWMAMLPPCRRCLLEKDPVILFLGASITRGYGLRKQYAYPQKIQQFLNDAGATYHVINGAQNGASTVHGLMQMHPFLQDGVNLQYLVIGLGSADAAYKTPIEKIDKNISQIVEIARMFNPDIKIFLFQHRVFQSPGRDKLDPMYKAKYALIFEAVAARENLIL
ncbi:MAG: SGNH/GDSL hydrolase family protein, partial [Aggregatilineales bacterium]